MDLPSSPPSAMPYEDLPPSSQTFASSPPPPSSPSSRPASRKPKKPPPITPKRFNKFFTPRTTRSNTSHSSSGRQLRDITRNAINRKKPTPRRTVVFSDSHAPGQENYSTPKVEHHRKRKLLPSPESSPIQPSPSKRSREHGFSVTFDLPDSNDVASDAETTILEEEEEEEDIPPMPIKRAPISGQTGRILSRSFGGSRAIGRGRMYDHCGVWQDQTANFCSRPEDRHVFRNDIPFCTASCNTNSMVAIGDEDGTIMLLESAKDSKPPFSQAHVKFRPHSNAVMDVAFSSDDYSLATASGDQTGHVIDVRTQQTTYVMGGQNGHQSSVKQVCFQPDNDNVLATSSRDGTVRLWDLRCKGSEGVIHSLQTNFDGQTSDNLQRVTCASTYNVISGAHAPNSTLNMSSQASTTRDAASKSDVHSRRGDVSITALSFLNLPSRSHLLVTASEASTAVKLWDIRGRYNRRAIPIATTRQPESHSKHRKFGINSISFSGAGDRLYALSRDNTVYAYSTSHLVLGHTPELGERTSERRRSGAVDKCGLGPLYGLRHPRLHVTSFWVKTALRRARGNKVECLAVGSSDGCPVVFPTDETMLRRRIDAVAANAEPPRSFQTFSTSARSSLLSTSLLNRTSYAAASRRRSSNSAITPIASPMSPRMADSLPIFSHHGTPLVRGHLKEVTSLTWTSEGDLVSIGDDYSARCWREDAALARDLRRGGEGEGRRWGSGWADVSDADDDDDDDE
ncbi:WD repeat-containing protein-like protein [Phyllosticta citrichinensis]|uniref:WD repeat-containing protein-like protein n=1 Tax=Phyllosticta citrichinensis TaxID=1130410 RepID=A0ABR1XHB3_9PEZI